MNNGPLISNNSMTSSVWNDLRRAKGGPWPYLRLWLLLTIFVEAMMFFFNHHLLFFYSVIAFLFLGAFLLRLMKWYPGQTEPLILDFSGAFLALVYAFLAQGLGHDPMRFLLIVTSSAIILPHIVYIFKTFLLE